MKIVWIVYCSSEPGYANLDFLNLIEELRKRHEIHLFSLSKQQDKNNFKYYSIKPILPHWIFVIFKVMMSMRKIKKLKPDVIISDSVFSISIPTYIISRILKIPLVIYCRELKLEILRIPKTNFNSPFREILKILRKFVLSNSELIVAMDEGLKEYFEKETRKKVYLVPASINFEEFNLTDIREELGLPLNTELILYIGHYAPNRGLDLLIESFSELLLRNKSLKGKVKLILGGRIGAKDRKYLNSLIKNYDVEKFIIILPYLPYSKVPSLIYSCDICVDPFPRPGVEEFQVGLKVIEYMAAGKPVLAIDVKGNRFVIKNRYNGLLAKPNIRDFTEKLQILIEYKSLRKRLGKNARKTILVKHNSKIVSENFEKLILRVKR